LAIILGLTRFLVDKPCIFNKPRSKKINKTRKKRFIIGTSRNLDQKIKKKGNESPKRNLGNKKTKKRKLEKKHNYGRRRRLLNSDVKQ
jgi:hypothetical protein